MPYSASTLLGMSSDEESFLLQEVSRTVVPQSRMAASIHNFIFPIFFDLKYIRLQRYVINLNVTNFLREIIGKVSQKYFWWNRFQYLITPMVPYNVQSMALKQIKALGQSRTACFKMDQRNPNSCKGCPRDVVVKFARFPPFLLAVCLIIITFVLDYGNAR